MEKMLPVSEGAEAFVELLNANRADFIFLNPGTDIAPIQEAVAKFKHLGKRAPDIILCLHESVAMEAPRGGSKAYVQPGRVMPLYAAASVPRAGLVGQVIMALDHLVFGGLDEAVDVAGYAPLRLHDIFAVMHSSGLEVVHRGGSRAEGAGLVTERCDCYLHSVHG